MTWTRRTMQTHPRTCDGPGVYYQCVRDSDASIACSLCCCVRYCSTQCMEADAALHQLWCHAEFSERLRRVARLLASTNGTVVECKGATNLAFNTRVRCRATKMWHRLNPFSDRSVSGNCIVCADSLENGGRRRTLYLEHHYANPLYYVKCRECRRYYDDGKLCNVTLMVPSQCRASSRQGAFVRWCLMRLVVELPVDVVVCIFGILRYLLHCKCGRSLSGIQQQQLAYRRERTLQ